MAQPIITLNQVEVDLGDKKLFSSLQLTLMPGEKLTLLGRNGSGKSTLLKLLSGLKEADDGDVQRSSTSIFSYLPQQISFQEDQTILDYCLAQHIESWQCEPLLEELHLDPHKKMSETSGGEQRKAALAALFAKASDVLLLDEPTNHLDVLTIQWLEGQLSRFRGSLILISHDRRFAENVTKSCLWLDRGQLHRVDAPLSEFEAWQENFYEKEELERAKLDKYIAEETRWSHQGITARRKRNQGRLRRLHELRTERKSQQDRQGTAKINIQTAQKSGKEAIVAENISFQWEGKPPCVKGFDLRLLRGDRLGIIGANGTGKTTLLKLLTGALKPQEGEVRQGTKLDVLWIDQNRAHLPMEKTIWEFLGDGSDHLDVQGHNRHIASYAQDFLFTSKQLNSPISSLSGGEQNRLYLASALRKKCNLLILDEPTNDLDMETLEILQDVLNDYDGTLILVSHDRYFLDQIVDSCLVFEGRGKVIEYAGGWSDAESQGAQLFDPQSKEKKKEKVKKKEETSKPKENRPKKLSFKHEYALKTLPKEIEELEIQIRQMEEKLSEQDFYQKDPEAFQRMSQNLLTAQQEKEAKEEQWLEIEMMIEELEL